MERDLWPEWRVWQARISIHALRMERDIGPVGVSGDPKISIHALRMERDLSRNRRINRVINFNPRAPHGARQSIKIVRLLRKNFNPRAPHGARRIERTTFSTICYFNPRAPHGARRGRCRCGCSPPQISIHALRMERDTPRIRDSM